MSDPVGRGITVTEINAKGTPVDVDRETAAVFIGRALRGPLDSPVTVRHYGDFRRRFGDCASGSGLGPAVKQFFDNGGIELAVIRVANNARGAMLCVPASGSALVLRAVEPGSTECIRAAVDFDRVDDGDDESFNLTLQRLDPCSGLVIDQEIHTGVSCRDGADNFIADALLDSSIARVEVPYPAHRPDATVDEDSRYELEWIEPVQAGTDGAALTDYDLIGSRERGTGLFALDGIDNVDLVYLPPTDTNREPGPAAVLAAEVYCRRRGAMLIVDPPADAADAATAVETICELGYSSAHLVGYFPRIRTRGDDAAAPVAAGGAVAGLLCKQDRARGIWAEDAEAPRFAHHITPSAALSGDDVRILARAGINRIETGAAGRARFTGMTTMDRGSALVHVFARLPVQRFCLRVANTIDVATRWAVFEQPGSEVTSRVRAQIDAYFAQLADAGAFECDRYTVQCHAEARMPGDSGPAGVTILVAFRPRGSDVPVSFTLHQSARGCHVTTTAFAPVAERCA